MNGEHSNKRKSMLSIALSGLFLSLAFTFVFDVWSETNISLIFVKLGDSFFVASVLYIGMGALIWTSLTGLFDIFGFGFKSLKYLFTPIKKDPSEGGYYEYVMEKREKRKGKTPPWFMLIVGVAMLALSILFTVLYYATGAADIIR